MAFTVVLLGTSYSIPETNDSNYDTALTSYLKALASAFPQLSGGTSTLTAELDFGASFGLKGLYFKSRTANPAASGLTRLASADAGPTWRNAANSGDVALAKDAGDALTWGGQNVTGNPMLAATTAAGQSIPNTTSTIVVFGTVVRDSDSGYNAATGRYTIPAGKGGDYLVSAAITWNAAFAAEGLLAVYKNAAEVYRVEYPSSPINGSNALNAIVTVAAGDILDLRVLQASGGAVVLRSFAAANFFTLKRIPT